jgi:hypothetical protein
MVFHSYREIIAQYGEFYSPSFLTRFFIPTPKRPLFSICKHRKWSYREIPTQYRESNSFLHQEYGEFYLQYGESIFE